MKRLAEQTLYEILEVPFDATPAVIAEAVERARSLYGPGSLATYTLMSTEEAELLSRRIDEAQSTLLDPVARSGYDEKITRPDEPGSRPAARLPPPGWSPPPIIPALETIRPDPDEDDEEELTGEQELAPQREPEPVPLAVPPPVPAPAAVPEPPRPILLSREVPDPALAREGEAVAAAPPEPAPPAPPPPPSGPIATPIPLAEPPRPTLPPTDATAWSGEVLRQLREARGITVQQLSERTKVTRHHIENIEGERYGLLPAAVYLRGILLSIARELRLDGQKVARSYLERVATARTR